jgi:hypothetical protein
MLNEKNEVVYKLVADPTDWVPEGWRLVEIPDGYVWNGKEAVNIETLTPIQVTPEVI